MRGLLFLTLCTTVLILYSCKNDSYKDIESYYFPVNELADGKVFEYRSATNDTLPPRYWYLISEMEDGVQLLKSNYYDFTFINKQFVKEKIVESGVLTLEYKLMTFDPEEDSLQVVDIDVIKKNTYPFKVKKDGGVFPMELKFKDPRDAKEDIRLIRERKYIGDTIFTFQDKDYASIIFSANEIREFTHPDKGDFDNTTYATEIYAKGLGMISREYEIGGAKVEYVLHDTFSIEELEKKASRYWNADIDLTPEN